MRTALMLVTLVLVSLVAVTSAITHNPSTTVDGIPEAAQVTELTPIEGTPMDFQTMGFGVCVCTCVSPTQSLDGLEWPNPTCDALNGTECDWSGPQGYYNNCYDA